MFILKANITLKGKDNEFINKRDIGKYLERIFTRFSDESIDDYEFERNRKRCVNMNCNMHKNKINCDINCNSYEKSLQIVQRILKLDTQNFLDYAFEVNSLELREIEEFNVDDNVINLATY